MLGDNAYPQGTDQQYQMNLFEIYPRSLRQTVLYPTQGNHDLFDSDAGTFPYYDMFSLPELGEAGGVPSGTEEYYAVDFGNVHLVVLSSMNVIFGGFGDDMLAWLAADLADVTEDWIIVTFHHPPYSKGGHDSDDPLDSNGRLIWMRENAVPIFDDYGVDLVLTGHSHSYERSYLIDGHYGDSTTFQESMKKDPGDGNDNGVDGPYIKPLRGDVPYLADGDGVVFTVSGSASGLTPGKAIDLGGTEPNHPAMVISLLELGSVVLDVNGNRLDAKFLTAAGEVLDEFTVFKGERTQRPVADFQASPRIVPVPGLVSFQDASLNLPTLWDWDFDDDGQSDGTGPAPSFQFAIPGLHPVTLVATNSAGADQETKSSFICAKSGFPGAVTGLRFDEDPTEFFWNPAAHATGYDAVRGDLTALLQGDVASLDLACVVNDAPGLETEDGTEPAPGQALFYVIGAANCAAEQGSFDPPGPGAVIPRDPLLLPVCVSCATGFDDDADEICTDEDNCPDVHNPGQEDGDSDGTGDPCDGCPTDPNKSEPGQCGCFFADTDSDSDGTADCVDDCPMDPYKIDPGLCGCGISDVDSDSDGEPDCTDECPFDPDKTEPEICGCGTPETDSDSDGTPDCIDLCPLDPLKIDPGVCGCGTSDTDSDSDGTPDCIDLCPFDPNKIDPGVCGCGTPDVDSDADGTPDCIDFCPLDTNKTEPGICGCGHPDVDSDSDGVLDCFDECPLDPFKIVPGVCGCGTPDVDSDLDGVLDCLDGCPFDPFKIEPGLCGCGVSECGVTLFSGTTRDLEAVEAVRSSRPRPEATSGPRRPPVCRETWKRWTFPRTPRRATPWATRGGSCAPATAGRPGSDWTPEPPSTSVGWTSSWAFPRVTSSATTGRSSRPRTGATPGYPRTPKRPRSSRRSSSRTTVPSALSWDAAARSSRPPTAV
jgi:PKD repeat protein